MATYVDTRTAADNELSYQGLIRCAVCDYLAAKRIRCMLSDMPQMIMMEMFYIER